MITRHTASRPDIGRRKIHPHPIVVASLLAAATLAGCTTARTPGSPRPSSSSPAIYQRGQASYYAARFDGRATSSGAAYNPHALTAAHRTLPLGTRVRVVNLNNDKHVTVRINDRGPFADSRIIDLSKAAAKKLRMRHDGVVPVTLEIVSEPN